MAPGSTACRQPSRRTHRGVQLLSSDAFVPRKGRHPCEMVPEKFGICEHRYRLTERVVVVCTEEDGGPLAIARYFEALVGGGGLLYEPGELGSGRGNRQC